MYILLNKILIKKERGDIADTCLLVGFCLSILPHLLGNITFVFSTHFYSSTCKHLAPVEDCIFSHTCIPWLQLMAQFLIRCFIFLLLNVKFLCIFWKRGSYQIWAFWKYFILVCSLSFHSLNIVYCTSEAFNLSPAYQFFLSGIIYLVLYLKSHHHFQDQ